MRKCGGALLLALVCGAIVGVISFGEAVASSSEYHVAEEEVIIPPGTPQGPADPRAGQPLLITAAGASSNKGHPVELQFRWGDDTPDSDWFMTADPPHVYEHPGTYMVMARARCQTHPEVVSGWSSGLDLPVRILETVVPPDFPDGPDSVVVGQEVVFSAAGAVSDLGHALRYQFNWGDGHLSGWGLPRGGHTYQTAGDYVVKTRARCAQHTYIISPWSAGRHVRVSSLPPESISAPYYPDGPSSGEGGVVLSFSVGDAVSNLGHPLEYQFDWGEGTPQGPWAASGLGEHAFGAPGTYLVRARARCGVHPEVVSEWSGGRPVLIAGGAYAVTWGVVGRGSVLLSPAKEAYQEGEQLTITAEPETGWRFHHWEVATGDDSTRCHDNPLVLSVGGATHVVAVFGEGSYVLRIACIGPGSVHISPDKPAYAAGDWVQLVASPDECATFSGWGGGATGNETPLLISMNADLDVSAGFNRQPGILEVEVVPPAGGSVHTEPQKEAYDWGEVVSLTVAAAEGYEFNHWEGDVFSTEDHLAVAVNRGVRVKAVFSRTTSEHFPLPEPQQSWQSLMGSLSICGETASPGDEIAIYDPQNTLCGQFTVVDPEGGYGLVKVWGDDPQKTPADEGAVPGDELSFVYWNHETGEETPLEAVDSQNGQPPAWSGEGTIANVGLYTICQESIPLHQGWNLISFRTNRCYGALGLPAVALLPGTVPVGSSVAEAFSSIDGLYQVVRGFDAGGAHTFDPSLPAAVNDLTYLAPGYGYWIKAREPRTLLLEGGRVLPQAGLWLRPGWNLVGCWSNEVRHTGGAPEVPFGTPPEVSMHQVSSAQDLLPGLVGTYDVLRGFDAGGAHTYDPALPPFLSDLSYVGPGYGYWLKMRTDMQLKNYQEGRIP
ncbi:MAG: hypothetical protein V2A77_08075 [Pseudomonadota bacterium]